MKKKELKRQLKELVQLTFHLTDCEMNLYERIRFTLSQKFKYYLSKQFRTELMELVSEYDFQKNIYDENQKFFEELQQSVEIITGGVVLERALESIRKDTDIEKHRINEYLRLIESFKDANAFHNPSNEKRHNLYKQ